MVFWYFVRKPSADSFLGKAVEARQALVKLRPKQTSEDAIDLELDTIQTAVRLEKECATSSSWLEIWKARDLVRLSIYIF